MAWMDDAGIRSIVAFKARCGEKEAKEEDFFNFKKNKKSDLGQLEINVTWLPTPKISNKKTHETRKQEWKE